MNITLKSNFQNTHEDLDNRHLKILEIIEAELKDLQYYQDQLKSLEMDMEDAVLQLIPDDIHHKITIVKAQYAKKINKQNNICRRSEMVIKELVTEHGESVKGDTLHAVYSAGRKTWDTKGLEGYAVANPDVLEFRKEGKPSVSIRKAK